jgi:CRISPR-associated protein (TIGR03986 family)
MSQGPADLLFHNPYNFVPTPPRPETGPLADAPPCGHDRLWPDRWTGRLTVEMTVETPLVVPDAGRTRTLAPGPRHQLLDLWLAPDGKPRLSRAALKGMLRSAYEAVTNSRFESFDPDYVGYRLPIEAALEMVPARLSDDGKELELLCGTATSPLDDGRRPLPAAALDQDKVAKQELGHGQRVQAHLSLWRRKGKGGFLVWNVDAVAPMAEPPPRDVPTPPHNNRQDYEAVIQAGAQVTRQVEGWIYLTGRPSRPGVRKHDERLFFRDGSTKPQTVPLTPALEESWARIITEYWEYTDSGKRPPNVASPHTPAREPRLRPGDLLYVRFDGPQALSLHPVLVTRGVYPKRPVELLHHSLKPATRLEELSPADRVFGWVGGSAQYRGNLRVARAEWYKGPAEAVERFGQTGLPLAILGSPKPQQVRFYLAADETGKPQPDGRDREAAGYGHGKFPRGRKFYLHHAGVPDGYWREPIDDRTQVPGWGQEYRRPKKDRGEQQDSQNKTIAAWVKPTAVFRFDVEVRNLSGVELGALLWLLSLRKGHFHRLGLGKPLGLGSVRLGVESADLATGEAWAARYLRPFDPAASAEDFRATVGQYRKEVSEAYAAAFEQVPFIAAFLRTAAGFDDGLPVHYPRTYQVRDPDGKNYEWFVQNEKGRKNKKGQQTEMGRKLALPDIATDKGLPYDPVESPAGNPRTSSAPRGGKRGTRGGTTR